MIPRLQQMGTHNHNSYTCWFDGLAKQFMYNPCKNMENKPSEEVSQYRDVHLNFYVIVQKSYYLQSHQNKLNSRVRSRANWNNTQYSINIYTCQLEFFKNSHTNKRE